MAINTTHYSKKGHRNIETEVPVHKPKKRRFGTIRPKGEKYEIQWYQDGERYSRTVDTYDEGDMALNAIELDIKRNNKKPDTVMLLGNWLTFWLDAYVLPNLSVGTYNRYKRDCSLHVIPHLGNIPLNKLSPDVFQEFFMEKKDSGRCDKLEGGLSTKTLRNLRAMLNSAFDQAIESRKISFNPVSGVKLPKIKKPVISAIERTQQAALEKICEASTKVNHLGILIDMYTGLRLGELMGLQWDCVFLDVEHPYIQIKQQLLRIERTPLDKYDGEIIREGEKTILLLTPVLKSSASYRNVYLPGFVADYFRIIKNWQESMTNVFGPEFNEKNWVICSEKFGDVYDPRTYQEMFYDIQKAVGMERVNFHILRHTFGTRLAEQRVPITTIAKVMGHSDATTCVRFYIHPDEFESMMAAGVFDYEGKPGVNFQIPKYVVVEGDMNVRDISKLLERKDAPRGFRPVDGPVEMPKAVVNA